MIALCNMNMMNEWHMEWQLTMPELCASPMYRCGNVAVNWKLFLVHTSVTCFETNHPTRFLEVWPRLSTRMPLELPKFGWMPGKIFSTR